MFSCFRSFSDHCTDVEEEIHKTPVASRMVLGAKTYPERVDTKFRNDDLHLGCNLTLGTAHKHVTESRSLRLEDGSCDILVRLVMLKLNKGGKREAEGQHDLSLSRLWHSF
jgi:hypothetical protein